MRLTAFIAAGILLGPTLAQAAAPESERPACPAVAAPAPAPWSGWADKAAVESAAGAAALPGAAAAPNRAYAVGLHPTRSVDYVAQPEKPGGSVAFGGMVSLTVDRAGVYRVGLDSGAWIDVLKDGTALVSTAHAPGPACTGVRKTVDFALQPGRYVVQVSANASPKLGLMIVRLP